LSRAQESAAKGQIGNPVSSGYVAQSPSSRSVADNVFVERIKSRVGHWISACKHSDTKTNGEQIPLSLCDDLIYFFLITSCCLQMF